MANEQDRKKINDLKTERTKVGNDKNRHVNNLQIIKSLVTRLEKVRDMIENTKGNLNSNFIIEGKGYMSLELDNTLPTIISTINNFNNTVIPEINVCIRNCDTRISEIDTDIRKLG